MLMSALALVLGIMEKMGIGNRPSPLCLVNLNSIMKSISLTIQGLLCLVMTGFGIALAKHINQTRKASGRKRSATEKIIQTRFALYSSVMISSFVLQMIHEMAEINDDVVFVAILILRTTMVPLAFPIMFVLSTRQYKDKVKKLFKR